MPIDIGDVYVNVKPNPASAATFTTSMNKMLAPLGGSLGSMSGLLTKGLEVAAVVAVGKFVQYAVHAFEEEQLAIAQLNQQIAVSPQLVGASTEAFIEQAKALSALTGIYDDDIIAADAILARYSLTQEQIQQLIPLVLDYARVVGVDATTAAGNIGRALLGNARALKAVGVNFKATGDRGKDFEAIFAALSTHVGGFAEKYGQTLPGQMERLGATFHNIAAEAGKSLAPALTSVASAMGDILTDVGPFVGVVVGEIGKAIATLVELVQKAIDISPGLISILGELAGKTEENGEKTEGWFQKLMKITPGIGSWNGALEKSDADLAGVTEQMVKFAIGGDAAAAVTTTLTTDQIKLAASILGTMDAYTSAATGVMGLVDAYKAQRKADRQLTIAEKQLAAAQKSGDPAKIAQAEKKLAAAKRADFDATTSLDTAVNAWVKGNVTANMSADDAVAAFKEYAHGAGYTKREIAAMTKLLGPAVEKQKELTDELTGQPDSVTTKVSLTGPAIQQSQELLDNLNTFVGRTWNVPLNITVTGNGAAVGTLNVDLNAAEGAYIPHRPGGYIARVGEGRYDEVIMPVIPGMGSDGGRTPVDLVLEDGVRLRGYIRSRFGEEFAAESRHQSMRARAG